jgi:uncharacterized protein (DUF1800 family)
MSGAQRGVEISRRRLLELSGKGVGFAALGSVLSACGGGGAESGTTPAPVPPPTPQPPPERIPTASPAYTMLKRTSFGVNRTVLDEVEAGGVEAYLDRQFDYQTLDDSALEAAIAARFPLAGQPPGVLRLGFPDNFGDIVFQQTAATLYRATYSPRQLYEVMVEFWSNHFSIHILNGFEPVLKPWDDATVIRPHALGNFRDMLRASAQSSAMLFYLDNFLNTVEAPNENYARELLELHTLGVDGGYTEQDVKEVARCFTGWTISFETGEFQFVPFLHDYGEKFVLGQQIPAGGGQSDAETVLDLLAEHPSTAQFLATKLCRRFIADDPAAGAVQRVASAFESSGGDIETTLRAVFEEPDFYDQADSKFARPMEFLVQLERALNPGLRLPADGGQLLFNLGSVLGQLPFYWPAPDGYPDVASYWANTSGLLNRWRLALFLSYDGGYALQDLLSGENTINGVVDRMSDELLMRELDAGDRQLIVDWLVGVTGLGADATIPSGSLGELLPAVSSLMLSSTYFQLR